MASFLSFKREEKNYRKALKKLLGFSPRHLALYKKAFIDPALRSEKQLAAKDTNDRLEFLGDSLLGMAIAKYLFMQTPEETTVGELASLKSHMVSREVANAVARRIGVDSFLPKKEGILYSKDSLGNALEALIAAIYLDRGFTFVERFIYTKLIPLYLEKKRELLHFGRNHKGDLQCLTAQKKQKLSYETKRQSRQRHLAFVSKVLIDGKVCGQGVGHTKKEAEQQAAASALSKLAK